jgi:propanediol dehydratase small subunit
MNSLFVETVKTVKGKTISTVTCQSIVLQTLTAEQVIILGSGLNQLEDSKQARYIKALQTAINSL